MANRRTCWLACAGALALLSGCVERRFVVNSEPSGAKVYVNNKPVGFTPVDVPFTYYGVYAITLEHPGHQTKHIEQHVKAPIYAYPPIDFFAESVYPGKIRDIRQYDYCMDPKPRPNLDELRQQADDLRARGKELPEPSIPTQKKDQQRQLPPATPPPMTPPIPDVLPEPRPAPPGLDPIP